ncbi:MAG: DnaD domain protein, partial [Mycoplasmataceae bacterium]|nr:DnaD domain protein [Mycoplasmataceae bacterium]
IITAKGIDWSLFWDVNLEGKLIDVIVIHDVSVVDLSMEIIEEFQTNNFNINRLIKKIVSSYSKKAIIDDFVNLEGNKLNFLESMTVSQYFTNKLERDPSTTELKLITKLKEKYGFGDYKINILIDYSIIVNNGAINKNYILKISDTIINEGMNTPQELIKHLKVSYKMKKNGNTKKLINSKIEMKDKPIF